MQEDLKKLILEAKNICVIPSQGTMLHPASPGPESLAASVALFYTLKDLGKNVNLIIDDFPEKLQFLVPSLEFISQPQNFVISIPRSIAEVSQIYYEKNEDQLKIHVTTTKGQLKKDHISFYAESPKPDLIITLGIQDFKEQLSHKLDSFGFLLGAPIINIDNNPLNVRFGIINSVEVKSLTEITLDIIRGFGDGHVSKPAADCLTAGLAEYLIKKRT